MYASLVVCTAISMAVGMRGRELTGMKEVLSSGEAMVTSGECRTNLAIDIKHSK